MAKLTVAERRRRKVARLIKRSIGGDAKLLVNVFRLDNAICRMLADEYARGLSDAESPTPGKVTGP